jgi:hypothetical protein
VISWYLDNPSWLNWAKFYSRINSYS